MNYSCLKDHYFKKILPYHKTKIKKRFCRSQNPYDQEVWNIENMRNIEIDDPINYGFGIKIKSILGPINFTWGRGYDTIMNKSSKRINIFYFNFGVKL